MKTEHLESLVYFISGALAALLTFSFLYFTHEFVQVAFHGHEAMQLPFGVEAYFNPDGTFYKFIK